MAATTSPDGIVYPVLSDQGDDIPAVLATLAGSVQTAITNLRNSINNHKGIPKAIASGTYVEGTPVALQMGDTRNVTVTFPAGRFSTAPKVNFGTWNTRLTIGLVSASATSMTVQMKNNSNGAGPSANFDWVAVEV